MTKKLSRVEFDEIHEAQEIYNQAVIYARTVGKIDWEIPFPEQTLEDYWEQNELYCVRGGFEQLVAVVRLSTEANPQIWQDNVKSLYVGKIAVGHEARQVGVATKIIIPAAHEIAVQRELDEVRLDCLADNGRLRRFYQRDFTERGEAEIMSKYGDQLRVARFASEVTT